MSSDGSLIKPIRQVSGLFGSAAVFYIVYLSLQENLTLGFYPSALLVLVVVFLLFGPEAAISIFEAAAELLNAWRGSE